MRTTLFVLSLASLACPDPDPLALYRRWRRSPSVELRIQAARSLRGQAGAASRAALLTLLGDDHIAVRAAAREELVLRPPDEGPDLAHELRRLQDPVARREGVRAILARREDPTLFADDGDPEVRARALASGRVAVPAVREALGHRDGLTRAFALELLGEPEVARAHLEDRAEQVRVAVARTLDRPEGLRELLSDTSWRVRLAAVRACARLREAACVPWLIEALEREEPGRVRHDLLAALADVTGADLGEDASRWRNWWRNAAARFQPPPPRAERPAAEHTTAVVRFRRLPVWSRRLAFVLDASRSMEKPAPGRDGTSRWQIMVEDLVSIVEKLPPDARFNVVLFRTDVEAWQERLVAANGAAKRACEKWIREAQPAGWTNLFDAVELALSDEQVDTIYVLTDGVPSRGRETARRAILEEVEFLNRYRMVAIHCIQAGGSEGLSKRWEGFLEELAEAHAGMSIVE